MGRRTSRNGRFSSYAKSKLFYRMRCPLQSHHPSAGCKSPLNPSNFHHCCYRLLDEVARDSPLSIFVEHGSNRLHRRLLVLEAALVLNDHILAIRRARQRFGVSSALELARQHLAQRITASPERALPLLLGDVGLEKLRGLLPTVRIFPGVDQGQPCIGGLLRKLFGFLLGLDRRANS